MKKQEGIVKSIVRYLNKTLPILNNDFLTSINKITSAVKDGNKITIAMENPHGFDDMDENDALFVSGIKTVFDISNIEVFEANLVKITTSIAHNIGQDAILSLELIGFDNINGIYANQRKIIQPNNNEFYIPKSLFKTMDFSGENRQVAIHIMRYGYESYNRHLKKSEITITSPTQLSYLIDEREIGTPYISSIPSDFPYLKSKANVIEVRDLYTGIASQYSLEDNEYRDNCIMVGRIGSDATSNPDSKHGTNYAGDGRLLLNETILIWLVINRNNAIDDSIVNDIIDNALIDINMLMSQFKRFYTDSRYYKIGSISYNGDAFVDVRDDKQARIVECQEIRFNITRNASADKFSDLDQSMAFSYMQAFINEGVSTPKALI